MSEPVKRTRRYESPRRRAQAEATRAQILESAGTLFERQGYAATTMAAVAADAGVALKTVYVAFETKSGLLRALWHLRLRGDQEELAVQDRDWHHEVLDEPDAVRKLRATARNSRVVKERVGALFDVIRGAATTDPEVAALWSRIEAEFHGVQRTIVESIAARRALRRGVDVDRAADVLWTLNHPDVWRLLVRERGWTPEEWEKWFGDTAIAQLLRRPPARPRR
jgi:AcrR family transcriptional regulator